MRSVFEKAPAYGRMIRFSHSVFALPFALTSAAVAARLGGVTAGQVFWIVVAMVGAAWADGRRPGRELGTGLYVRRRSPRWGQPDARSGSRG